VIDAPGGGGKIPMLPQYVVGKNGNDIIVRNYKYDIYSYPDVVEEQTIPQETESKFMRRKSRVIEKETEKVVEV